VKRGDLIAGRYRLDAESGSAATGEVWRATEQGSEAVVALTRVRLSQMPPDQRERVRGRLRGEVGIASLLDHPNIASVHGLVEHEGDPWVVTRFVGAPSLAELTSSGPIPPTRAAAIGAQVAGALAYAHSPGLGVLHGGVSPRTVLVGSGDQVFLTGFGIPTPHGSPTYLPPEVVNGMEGGPQADVFSLGATLYAAVEGRPPWGDGTPEQTRAAAMKGVVDPPRRAGALGPVLTRMLESRPRERPTAAEAAQLLGEVARGGGDAGGGGSRKRWLWVAAAAVVVLALVGVGLVAWPSSNPELVATGPGPTLGDPATADPCALLSTDHLKRFGKTILETDGGNFDRCDVYIENGADRAVARLQLSAASAAPPQGEVEQREGLLLVRGAPTPAAPGTVAECVRTLRLTDGHDIRVVGQLLVGAGPEPCAVADVATDTALIVLASGSVPRRPAAFPARSIATVDACGLLDRAVVTRVPSLETAEADPGYAGWDCDWENATTGASIVVTYDRDNEIRPEAGRRVRIAGRDAAVQPDADAAGCDVTIAYGPYTRPNGDPAQELLVVKVDQPAPVPDPCVLGQEVATAAVQRLPKAP
jgi:serine/threonine-protein kinase